MSERYSIRLRLRDLAHALRLRGPLAADPTARMLYALVLALAIWYAVWTIVLIPLYPNRLVRLGVAVLAEVGPVAALILLRLGLLRQATLIYLAGTWVYATVRMSLGSGIQSTTQTIYVTLPILATWLLGYREALWTAGICLGSSLFFALLEMTGVHQHRPIPVAPLAIWATLVQVILIGAVPIAQILQSLRETVAQSRRDREELQEYKEHLEHQVTQRTVELVEARDEAMAANQAKSAFLANMSHELRTPLNAILGFSRLLRARSSSDEQRKDLDIISRSGEHLLGLIDDVLDVAKVEAGGSVLEIAPCDLTGVVRGVIEMMRPRALEKGLALTLVEAPPFARYVRADAARLRQILMNLLGNALKFTEHGSVTVLLNSRPGKFSNQLVVTLEIEDTGVGIAPEDRERIFDAFVQVGRPRSQKGTGLGLAINRRFIELMGGRIQVESALGKGSLFRVELPVECAPEFEKASAASWEEIPSLEPGQPEYTVLIVEDEWENRVVLARLLRNAGFRVLAAEHGAQGIERFEQWRPQFIWMDLRMPVMDGFEATRRIRALEGGREVKIAAVTASVFYRSEAVAGGFDDFVNKPYRPSEIFECMARHLGVRYCRREPAPSDGQPPVPLRAEELASLPEDLRAELRAALIALDVGWISHTIGLVAEHDAALGAALSYSAGQFAYTEIFDAVEAARQQSAGAR